MAEREAERQLYLQAVRAARDLRDNLDALIGMNTAPGKRVRPAWEYRIREMRQQASDSHHWLSDLLEL